LYREYTREGSQILLKLVDVIMDGPQTNVGRAFISLSTALSPSVSEPLRL